MTQSTIGGIVKNINNLNKGIFKMISYNLILYIGLFLIISGFILFIISEIKLRQLEIEQFKQEQLHKSFMKNKNKLK